jgi:hypothetical protein
VGGLRSPEDDIRVNPAARRMRNNGEVLIRVLAVLVVWCGAALFDLAVAKFTRIGPVLVNLGRGHGVHAGDLLAVAFTGFVAVLLTAVLLRRA